MKHSLLVADVDGAVLEAGRRLDRAGLVLPLLLAVNQIQSVQVLVQGADVHGIANDGRRPLDAILDLDLPANHQRIGQGPEGDPALLGIAAEEGPVGLGQAHGTEDRQHAQPFAHDKLNFSFSFAVALAPNDQTYLFSFIERKTTTTYRFTPPPDTGPKDRRRSPAAD